MPESMTSQASDIAIDLPNCVYHYTDIHGFCGIIRTSSVWLTDAFSTNDYSEIRIGIDLTSDMIDAVSKKFGGLYGHTIRLLWRENRKLHPFIAAFSGNGNQLAQWRSYADSGRGFCIGIRSRSLAANSKIPRHTASQFARDALGFAQVNYLPHPSQNPGAIKQVLEQQTQSWEPIAPKNDAELHLNASLLVSYLASASTFIKNRDFQEEGEWRLVYLPFITVSQTDPNDIRIDGPMRKLEFRVKEGKLVSYFVHTLTNEFGPFVDNVVLGPANPSTEGDVKLFLREYGLGGVPVTRSGISFRN